MIENLDNQQPEKKTPYPRPLPGTPTRRPNEAGAFSIEAHVKIFDPTTKEIFVEKRA